MVDSGKIFFITGFLTAESARNSRMPRAWKRLFEYSKSGLNKLKRRCPPTSSDDSSEDEPNIRGHGAPASETDSDADSVRVERSEHQRDTDSSECASVRSEHDFVPSDHELVNSGQSSDEIRELSEEDNSGHDTDRTSDDSIIATEEDEFHSGSEHRSANDSSSTASSGDDDDYLMNHGMNVVRERNAEPLYEGARLTVGESLIATMSMAVRHGMTKAMQADLLKFAELHCPPENNCKTTLHGLRKQFAGIDTPLTRHFYCRTCLRPVEHEKSVCPTCEESKNSYFLTASIRTQLQALFERPGFHNSLQHERIRRGVQDALNYADVYDGAVYRKLRENGSFLDNPSNISLIMYTDGVRIFSSSKFNIWPVYMVINELPYEIRTRKENVLRVALWFGDEKPSPNLFLTPLIENIRELRQGLDVRVPNIENPITVKGIIICCTCDLPAKALFYNMKQYNGKFGCQKCKQKGENLPNEHVRVYPYQHVTLRTDDETNEHAQQAFDVGFAVCGVKGPTVMKHILHNYMTAIAVDVMHCVFEGVVKKLLNFWFNSKYSGHPASIIEHVNQVDQRLKSLTPPSFVQRLPRSIKNHLPYWKAHELKSWLFYYSIPCIRDLLDEPYFKHHTLLVLGISLLCQSSISLEELDVASRALDEYVRRFEVLYDRRNMTNNVHQLLHLAETVRQFGPLWTTSCFPFEDLNGRLKRLVHGSNSAQLQVYSGAAKFLHLATLKNDILVEGRPAYEFCENLDTKCGRMKRHFIANTVYIIGRCTELRQLPADIAEVCQRENINGPRYFSYQRLLKQKALFSSTAYKRSKRTNSSFALYKTHAGANKIGQIKCFVRTTSCACRTLCHCLARNVAIVQPCIIENRIATDIDGTLLSKIHNVLGFDNHVEAVDILNLEFVCYYCNIDNIPETYVIEPINTIEFE